MSKKRIQYSIDFKVKMALDAIRGDKAVLQLEARYDVQPTQTNTWKYYLIERAAELFTQSNGAKKESATSVDDLYRVIGQLTVERDFWSGISTIEFRKTMTGLHRQLSKARQCGLSASP